MKLIEALEQVEVFAVEALKEVRKLKIQEVYVVNYIKLEFQGPTGPFKF